MFLIIRPLPFRLVMFFFPFIVEIGLPFLIIVLLSDEDEVTPVFFLLKSILLFEVNRYFWLNYSSEKIDGMKFSPPFKLYP